MIITRTFLTALFLCTALALFGTTVIGVALPAIQRDLGAGVDGLQWIVNAYTVCLAGLTLTGGALGDRYGRKRLLLLGILVFLLGSLVSALADGVGLVIAGRVGQGVGAAVLLPGSLSILARSTPDPVRRAALLGWWGLFGGLAAALGPVLGGLLVDGFGWWSVFLLNLPLGLAALVAVWVAVPESADPAHTALDPLGQLLGIAWPAALSLGLIRAGRHGLDLGVWITVGLAVLAAVLFVVVELRQPRPMVPVRLFADRAFAVANYASFALGFGPYAAFVLLALYLQQGRGLGAAESALWLLPLSVAMLVASPVAGRLTARLGGAAAMALGYGVAALGLAGCLLLGAGTPFALAALVFALVGLGMGLAMTPTNVTAFGAVPIERSGLASAVVNTTRQTGTVVGVALLGALYAAGTAGTDVLPGLRIALAVAAGVTLLAALAATLLRVRDKAHASAR
ncbi:MULTISPECIES: DHA2 family efflux MFS transporter permease subunit [unclassified Crossiella]|uniref:DHA2 family efflux MFS transporter permease subunit n=1 Tax=unclassified Crossiella TaxID=2620835 RepID=UPI001FFF48A9|nr:MULTISPECIES: DHA2 family efflux MFS transporter permease subunit [unclassified Crossiella]MCK2238563.1 DHA2 family efflux MFS transporter permease subunit [Crossiella sp. S99.2]MCK2251867.1 DHA2 family efflux MFS transporter permease subunit [Crossiella sp. S99.1]